jgi:hypothetical protein
MTKSLIMCQPSVSSGISTSATRYMTYQFSSTAISGTQSLHRSMVAVAGTVSSMYLSVLVAPGTGKTWTVTLQKNNTDTAMVCAITGTATTATYTATSISVAVGDVLNFKIVPSGTPSSCIMMNVSTVFETAGISVPIIGGVRASITTGTVYSPVAFGSYASPAGPGGLVNFVCPIAGLIKNQYVGVATAPGAGTSRTITLYKNGSATSLATTISNTATTGNDTTHSVRVAKGDILYNVLTVSGSTASSVVYAGYEFVPDVPGVFCLYSGSDTDGVSDTGVRYCPGIHASTVPPDAGEVYTRHGAAVNVLGMSIQLDAATGSGTAYAFVLQNESTTTKVTATVSDPSTSASSYGHALMPSGALATLKRTPTGTPNLTSLTISYPAVMQQYPNSLFMSD